MAEILHFDKCKGVINVKILGLIVGSCIQIRHRLGTKCSGVWDWPMTSHALLPV